MYEAALLNFINLFIFVFNIVLLLRVIISWFNPTMQGWFPSLLVDLTEPIVGPIRAILPKSQMLDFSPLVAFLLLQLLGELANRFFAG